MKMKLYAKTLITNKTRKDRHVLWANVSLAAGESRLVDGLFPSACADLPQVKDMEADIDAGNVSVVLVTNLPTSRPEQPAVSPQRQAVQAAAALAKKKAQAKAPAVVAAPKEPGVFQKGKLEDKAPAAVALKAPSGDVDAAPAQPATVYMFDTDPHAAQVTATSNDVDISLGTIKVPEMTRSAAQLIQKMQLTDAQIAEITKQGTVKRVTKAMVSGFLKESGQIGSGSAASEAEGLPGEPGSDTAKDAETGSVKGPDPDTFD
jgi:hypothetical protein